ncbi:MAG: S41 family peptidase [Muribaculaceae bacterium]|nr:S41 family peptidase [Muribaculaceae bacterium]
MNQIKKTSVWVPLTVALTFVLGFLGGDMLNHQSGPTTAQKKFQTILNLIKKDYVDEVDLDSLLEKTLPGLLTNLDPHSVYIPAEDLQSVNEELDGSFCGIGVQFMINNDTITVVEVVSGGPSEKIGIKAGDRIVSVDGENVAGIGLKNEQVLKKLRGERDSRVKLGIRRPSAKKTLTFEVTRGDIPQNTVTASYIASPGIGYVKVDKFGRTTYDEFWQALNQLKRDGAQDFIIDLRGNQGGFMEIAFLMANEFLEKGDIIVTTKERDYYAQKGVQADGNGNFKDSQVVVLLDEFSASSSEIFAGALQDNDRALIVGRRSFGKGLIQRQSVLPDSSAIRLTIGRYYTPSGRCIQKDYSNLAQYGHDILDRYNRGEMFSQDSIKLDKSIEFKTMHGRTVYGGGGIMPDIFVPNDTSGITSYYINVANAGLLQKFAFDYVDANREKFEDATSVEALEKLLPPDDSLLRQFVNFASRNGVSARWYYINISHDLIVNQLKGLIARDVLGYTAYFTIVNRMDSNVNRAIEELLGGGAAFPITDTGADAAPSDRQ